MCSEEKWSKKISSLLKRAITIYRGSSVKKKTEWWENVNSDSFVLTQFTLIRHSYVYVLHFALFIPISPFSFFSMSHFPLTKTKKKKKESSLLTPPAGVPTPILHTFYRSSFEWAYPVLWVSHAIQLSMNRTPYFISRFSSSQNARCALIRIKTEIENWLEWEED